MVLRPSTVAPPRVIASDASPLVIALPCPGLLLVPRTDLLDWAQPNPQAAPAWPLVRQKSPPPVTPRQPTVPSPVSLNPALERQSAAVRSAFGLDLPPPCCSTRMAMTSRVVRRGASPP